MSEVETYLSELTDVVGDDPRLSTKHISLILACLHFYLKQGQKYPITVFSRQLRLQAKLRSQRDYYYCMKDLKEWGYMKYTPSHNPTAGSQLILNRIGAKD